jgi:DNA-directed RNA polymerase sigma subunit (sigma70/sigma32)
LNNKNLSPKVFKPPSTITKMQYDIFEQIEDNKRRFVALATSSGTENPNQFEDYLAENSTLVKKVNPKKLDRFYEASVKNLTFEERQILSLRHGLDGADTYPFNEIASIFCETRKSILLKHQKALSKVRPYFEALLSLP